MKFVFVLIFFIVSIINSTSFSGAPASPSSSYKNDYLRKDNSIINKLEKNKFINIFENRITENKRYININNCYNNISSIINKKL